MKITITPPVSQGTTPSPVVLADDTVDATNHAAPPSDVHVLEEDSIQESKPIGSARRSLFSRANASGTLSFTVRPRYLTLAHAAAAAWAIAGRKGVTGTLAVYSNGASSAVSGAARSGAIIRKVDARQIGVTVEAKYEIVF